MPQQYVFEVTIEDSGDEFSEMFNPTSEQDVAEFEQSLKELLDMNGWDSTFVLKRVIVDL